MFKYDSSILKYGFIDENGKQVIEPKYKFFSFPSGFKQSFDFNEGYTVVLYDDTIPYFTFIDTLGNSVGSLFKFAYHFRDGFAIARDSTGKLGVFSKKGCFYQGITLPSNGFSVCVKDEKYGYRSFLDENDIEPKYDMAYSFCNGYARVLLEKKEMIVDVYGNEFEANTFSLSCTPCLKHYYLSYGRCGYMCSLNNDTVVPPVYKLCGAFFDGYATVKDDNHYYIINTEGEKILSFKENFTPSDVHNGFVRVKNVNNNKMYLLDVRGGIILPEEYDFIGPVSDNGIVLTKKENVFEYLRIIQKL